MTMPRAVTIQPAHAALDAYYHTLDTLRTTQAVSSEGNLRRAFGTLLSAIAAPKKWTLVEEDAARTGSGRAIYYDGVLRDEWKLPHGRWEAKDRSDDLEQSIRRKRDSGYVFDNILFEDTQTVVLFQNNLEIGRTSVRDRATFARLLTQFLNYEVAPFTTFKQAVGYFKDQITPIATGLKDRIESAHRDNRPFKTAYDEFFALCQNALNPNISRAAVDEMLIQHMLTERLISKLFVEEFIRRNIIASKVETVIDALTSGSFSRTEFLGSLDRFYKAIEDAADQLASPTDKQEFINTIYERFFQGYSVKTADTHGIVYTPQPIVDFMCASVEEVLKDEFGLALGAPGVTILDPATGTGNFAVHLINRVDERYLRDFYANQLFANEVMLMPYYIAALNIERAYYERTGRYEAFEGLCFVDTLDMQTGV
ncbi:MAG: N-6 DNA methylase, partial [Anaerolineae bacterium]|nr:N-6 DNA methylase [Anaerolineae bacterium]